MKAIPVSADLPRNPFVKTRLSHLISKSRPQQPKRWLRHKTILISLLFLLLISFSAIAAPWIAPFDPTETNLSARLAPPLSSRNGSFYMLGTDGLGRDLLSRIIYGGRISLLVGILAVLISGTIGVFAGLATGYFGGAIDEVVMRLADIQLAFPFILLALAIMAVLGASLLNVIVVLSLGGWVIYARLVRGEVIALKQREFLTSARAIGTRDWTILWRHVLPNVMNLVLVIATISVSQMILAEASLSFLGLGVQPPTPTWGGILSDGREYLITGVWWPTVFPGLAIAGTVLAISLIGDWLRDRLDPRLQL